MAISDWWAPTSVASSLASSDLKSKIREGREDFVRKDLTRRLKGVCSKLSTADFDALMLKMTLEQLRGEAILPR